MRLHLVSALTAAVLLAAPAWATSSVTNGDFETGTFSGWTQNGGYWYGGLNYPSNYSFGSAPYQSAIVTPGDVPALAGYGIHINRVDGGSYAARINSNDGGNYHFSQISQTFTNWDAPYISFDWSAVLQDSGHEHTATPHFQVMVDDLTTSSTFFNFGYSSDSLPSNILHRTGGSDYDYTYTGWQALSINTPSTHQGHTLKLTILASDCAYGGHDGALYVDNITAGAGNGGGETGNALPVAVPSATPFAVQTGETVHLDGTASYDAENDTIDSYLWDLNGDGVTDLTGSQPSFPVPVGWSGLHDISLRVHEATGGDGQWSPWATTQIDVTATPEPASLGLLGLGVVALVVRRRR